jgi:hypothetical protein
VSTTRCYGRHNISASTSNAGQRSSTPIPDQTTIRRKPHERIPIQTPFSGLSQGWKRIYTRAASRYKNLSTNTTSHDQKRTSTEGHEKVTKMPGYLRRQTLDHNKNCGGEGSRILPPIPGVPCGTERVGLRRKSSEPFVRTRLLGITHTT